MSTHPNAILILTLTPDDLARRTYRAILADNGIEERGEMTDDIQIGEEKYHHKVMEADYDEGYQIGANEGDIIIFDMFTYGYGDTVPWESLVNQKMLLEAWAKATCAKHNCTYKISVGANYW